jgi:hypothetical protein
MSFFKNLFNKQTPNETKYSLSQSKPIVAQPIENKTMPVAQPIQNGSMPDDESIPVAQPISNSEVKIELNKEQKADEQEANKDKQVLGFLDNLKSKVNLTTTDLKNATTAVFGKNQSTINLRSVSQMARSVGMVASIIPGIDKIAGLVVASAQYGVDLADYNKIKESIIDPLSQLKNTILFLTVLNEIIKKITTDKITELQSSDPEKTKSLIDLLEMIQKTQVSDKTIKSVQTKIAEILSILEDKSAVKQLYNFANDKTKEIQAIFASLNPDIDALEFQYTTIMATIPIYLKQVDEELPKIFFDQVSETKEYNDFMNDKNTFIEKVATTTGGRRRNKSRKLRKNKSKRNRRNHKNTRK